MSHTATSRNERLNSHFQKILLGIVDIAIQLTDADFGNIQLLDSETGELRIVAYRGFPDFWIKYWNNVSKGQGACGTALNLGSRIIIEDISKSPIFKNTAGDIQKKAGIAAVQSTPILNDSKKCVGMLSTHYKKPKKLGDTVLESLDTLALLVSGLIEQEEMRFQALENVEHILAALRQIEIGEKKYRDLVNTISEGVLIVDDSKRTIEFANPKMEQLFGYSSGELIGKPLSLLIPDRNKKIHEEHQTAYASAPRVRPMGAGLKIVGRRKDEGEIDIDISLSPFKTNGTTYTLAVVRDISEQRRLELEAARVLDLERNARELAEKANHIKDDFLATLSHELRTPLTTILMWAQMLRQKKVAPDKLEGALRAIEQSAFTQNQLIGDLLDVSRILTGKLILEFVNADLNLLIHDAIETVLPAANAKMIRIDASFDSAIGMISCDPVRIKQVMWNLLVNAIKFSNNDGVISVKSKIVDKFVQIQVIDKGKGINADFLPTVFERFSQEDSSMTRKHGGLGLGLSIVRDLVRLHDGTVSVESLGENLGATFTVNLPIARRNPLNASLGRKDKGIELGLGDFNFEGCRILVVDDSIDSRLVFQAALENMGANVKTAASAKEGLSLIQEYRPNILISDISMPEVDGITFIKSVRQLNKSQGGDIPAIALTAHAGSEDVKKIISAGFQSHISKPVEFRVLGLELIKYLQPKF